MISRAHWRPGDAQHGRKRRGIALRIAAGQDPQGSGDLIRDLAQNHEALIADGLINASADVIALAGDLVDETHVVNSSAQVAD